MSYVVSDPSVAARRATHVIKTAFAVGPSADPVWLQAACGADAGKEGAGHGGESAPEVSRISERQGAYIPVLTAMCRIIIRSGSGGRADRITDHALGADDQARIEVGARFEGAVVGIGHPEGVEIGDRRVGIVKGALCGFYKMPPRC